MHASKRPRWIRSSLLVVGALLLTGMGFVGYAAFRAHHVVTVIVPDCYAQEWFASLVIEYMKENDDRWPKGWADLSRPYAALSKQQEIPWSLVELQERVEIRFDVDPQALRNTRASNDELPFKVIYLRSGEKHHWQGAEPNRIVWDYLNASQ